MCYLKILYLPTLHTSLHLVVNALKKLFQKSKLRTSIRLICAHGIAYFIFSTNVHKVRFYALYTECAKLNFRRTAVRKIIFAPRCRFSYLCKIHCVKYSIDTFTPFCVQTEVESFNLCVLEHFLAHFQLELCSI